MSGTPATRRAAGARPDASGRANGVRGRWLTPVNVAIALAVALALGLRLYQLSRPGYLLGVTEYDDAADFGSAIRLVHGSLPYRDFIMVQPPGITILMAPVALAAKGAGSAGALAAGRLLTAAASAAGVALTGLLVRRQGLLATVVACGLLAVYPDSVLAAHTVMLEPWLVLFCLAGAVIVFDGDRLATGWRRLAWGGAAFGFAGAVKVWAIIPVAVVLALTVRKPRRAAVFAGGAAVGFLVPVAPFAAMAPRTFVDSVVVAQLVRVDATRKPLAYRIQHMAGLTHLHHLGTGTLALAAAVIVGVVAASVAGAWLATRRPPPPLETFALATAALVVAAFLWPADFYYHYSAFLAPFLAMAIALPLGRLAGALAARDPALARPLTGGAIGVAVAAALVFGAIQGQAETRLRPNPSAATVAAIRRVVPPGSCLLTDQMSVAIAADRFVSGAPGCSVMVDGVGADYSLSHGRNGVTGAGRYPAVRALWRSAFDAAQYVWLSKPAYADRRIAWTPALRAYFHRHFTQVPGGPARLYRRVR